MGLSIRQLGLPHDIAAVFHESEFQGTGKEICQFLKASVWKSHSITHNIIPFVKRSLSLPRFKVSVEEEVVIRKKVSSSLR